MKNDQGVLVEAAFSSYVEGGRLRVEAGDHGGGVLLGLGPGSVGVVPAVGHLHAVACGRTSSLLACGMCSEVQEERLSAGGR